MIAISGNKICRFWQLLNCSQLPFLQLLYITVGLYHTGVGMAHKITSPKNQSQFSLTTMRQYWLGKTKPKSFQINPKCFQQVATEF